jgi:hypothetical protein
MEILHRARCTNLHHAVISCPKQPNDKIRFLGVYN